MGVDWTARRSDARRNHELVMRAARAVFAERGAEGTIPEVAARAGVGKATVYRSHPTKEALLEAVSADHLAWFRRRVDAALQQPDAFEALRSLLVDISERVARDRLFIEVVGRARQQPHFPVAEFERLLDRGRREGTLRPDASYVDIQILMSGYGRVLIDRNVDDPEIWRRYASLTLDALRARPE